MPLLPWIFDRMPIGGGGLRDVIAPTLSSAEVGNVANNKIVLTYSELLDTTSVPATTDFSVNDGAANVVTGVSISGVKVTLTLTNVIYGFQTVVVSYTAGINKIRDLVLNNASNLINQSVTNNCALFPSILSDGNTAAWYDADVAYITKDGSNFVSQWNDRSGNLRHLLQGTGTNQPLWSSNGVLFDGVDNYMKATGFTLIQPEFIYIVFKQITWTLNDWIFDGNSSNTGRLGQRTVTPNLQSYAGASSGEVSDLLINTWGIVRVLFNGANSILRVNENAAWTGNAGASNMGGFTLAALGGISGFSNIEVKEIIVRKISETADNQTLVYNYLKGKHGL